VAHALTHIVLPIAVTLALLAWALISEHHHKLHMRRLRNEHPDWFINEPRLPTK
jgi:hypothetical protein